MNYKNKHNSNRLRTFVFYSLIIMVMLFVVSTYLASSLVAKYTSSDSASASARVAQWDIKFGNEELKSIVSSTHLEAGSKGDWGLNITNNSEVTAKFSSSSNVKLRLHSPNFDLTHNHNTWDFLEEKGTHNHIDNPINFRIYLYNCSLDEIALGNYKSVEILDTNNPLTFQLIVDEGHLFYETVVDFERLNLSSDFYLSFINGKASLKVFWEVNGSSNQAEITNTFYSYHYINRSEYNSYKYDGILDKTLTNKIANAKLDDATINANMINSNYVMAYNEYDYFEYFIYTSTLGGEVCVTVKNNENKDILQKYSKLDSVEKASVRSRTVASDGYELYTEALELMAYEEFLEAKTKYDNETGYLGLGLECRIMLNLRVEQVD